MAKPSKTELFYTDMKELIKKDMIYWEIDNYEEIEENVENYLITQKHFKKVGHRWSNELFHYMLAEGMLDIIEKNLSRLKKERVVNPFTYENFYNFVMTKINDIGVYKIVYCGSDATTNKFLRYNKKRLEDMYYNLDEETKKKSKLLKLIVARAELRKIVNYSSSVKKALEETEEEIKEILSLE